MVIMTMVMKIHGDLRSRSPGTALCFLEWLHRYWLPEPRLLSVTMLVDDPWEMLEARALVGAIVDPRRTSIMIELLFLRVPGNFLWKT